MDSKKKGFALISETHLNQYKNNDFLSLFQQVREYFDQNLASRWMCSYATDIRISNVCYLVGMLLDSGEIKVCKKDRCVISGELVQFLSCDREYWPEELETQLSLFEERRAD